MQRLPPSCWRRALGTAAPPSPLGWSVVFFWGLEMWVALAPGDGMGELPLAHLPDPPHGPKASEPQGQSLAELERRQIVLELLKACRRLNELQLRLT